MSIEILNISNTYTMYYYTNDNDWQRPVKTEYQIYKLFKEQKNIPINYFAFPWATLIDKKFTDNNKIKLMIEKYKIEKKPCFTVIQHIRFRNYIDLIKKIGIEYIFTPHKQPSDSELEKKYGVKIISISLFPVQFNSNGIIPVNQRKYLTSFIGQYDEKCYLTDIRLKIFDYFKNYSNCYIKRRGEWHYQGMVYRDESNTHKNNEDEYINILSQSKFSLCPSGSGPNSIRIWESMSYGSIPVILADTLILPEIKNINWNNFFIIWNEKEIDKLYDYLVKIKPKYLDLLSNNCIKLYNTFFSPEKMNILINRFFKENKLINFIDKINLEYNIVSYCCGKYPSIGGVERYDAQLKMIFPNRVFFQGPKEKDKMLEYLKNTKNPIIITDNHLSCDIPNDYPVLLVHHGCAKTHAERDSNWKGITMELCCNGQDKMLSIREPKKTWIISSSSFCKDQFKKYYRDKYSLFDNYLILHSSEFNSTIFKTTFNKFKPIILGNWSTFNKGQQIIPAIKSLTDKYEFKQLQIKPNQNESLNDFNLRKQQIYLDSDIFLQLSVSEGNSYASLDALFCGLVVVASNVGAFYKDVPEDCFVKIPWEKNNDANYVMERIEYAWNNREILSINARKWALENCNFELWKKKMYKIVKKFYEHNYD